MSIQLSLDGLYYCVYDPVENLFVAYGYHAVAEPDMHFAKHEEIMLTHDIFGEKYKRVDVGIESEGFTMVPTQLFDEQKIRETLTFTGHEPSEDSHLAHDTIEVSGATLLYYVPNFLYRFLRMQFDEVRILNTATPMINAMLMKREAMQTRDLVNISMSTGKMVLAASHNNRLQLCTEYACHDVNDYVYMTMNAMQQLQFDANETQINVSGALDMGDERFALLQRFARNVKMTATPKYFDFDFDVEQPQRFNNLFNITLCE